MTKNDAAIALAPRPRGRPARTAKPVAADETLLARAFELFAERGYEGAAVRDIARQLGISHTLLRQRFGSKQAIWLRAVDARVERMSQPAYDALDAQAPPAERLRRLVRAFCRSVIEDPAAVGMINSEAHRDSWRLDHLVREFVEPFQTRLSPLLAALAADGAPPLPTVVFLSLMVNGAGSYFAARPMMRRLETVSKTSDESRIATFEQALLAAARGGAPPTDGEGNRLPTPR